MSLREDFERDGVARVTGAIAADDVRAMCACALARVAAIELVEIAGALRPAPGQELALWEIGRDPAFDRLPDALARAVDVAFGAGAWSQVDGERGGLLMPNFPCPGATPGVSEVSWHVDEPIPADASPGRVLLAYAFLDRVEPGGGATVAIAGSHRGRSGRPIELVGEAGDVVFLDPRCRHTISANVSTRPRLVMRLTCMR
jgi:hypothetical protein